MPRTFVWHRTRGPHHTPKEEEPTSGKVRIEQVRSGIGKPATMRLQHLDVVIQRDAASWRGQIKKGLHLVKVSPVQE